ncbi:GyrI-like domain-containing protein [Henriciella litoralis]|uniref:GyrI-like domain-containing protein n=1 Tax=Henriciella litoralis TaxID=568102 RepID=UPI0009FC20AA|nr:GyrI-like domain-containing protein [Henriciella litoralis]
MAIERRTLPALHYLYTDHAEQLDAAAVAEAMGRGFAEVGAFLQAHDIAPLSMPVAVYVEMPGNERLAFRTGIFVSEKDALKASGNVKQGFIPEGDAAMDTHVGSYQTLHVSHKQLWDDMLDWGITKGLPMWELYVDDPGVVPEAELRTEIYRRVG